MYKTAVVGDKESIYGFSAIGIETFPVFSGAKAQEIVKRLAENDYGIIFVTDDIAREIRNVIDEYKDKPLPAIIPIPDVKGNEYGMLSLKRMIERATGIADR